MNNWQIDQIGCKCIFHRYHVAHLCECGKLYPHSQAACDEHRNHNCLFFSPQEFYKHGDAAKDVFERLMISGKINYQSNGFQKVYNFFCRIGIDGKIGKLKQPEMSSRGEIHENCIQTMD